MKTGAFRDELSEFFGYKVSSLETDQAGEHKSAIIILGVASSWHSSKSRNSGINFSVYFNCVIIFFLLFFSEIISKVFVLK